MVDVRLTAAGKRLEKKALEIQQTALCRLDLPVAELRDLRDSLKGITRNLKTGEPR